MTKFVSRKLLAYLVGIIMVVLIALIPFELAVHQLVIHAVQAMAVTYLGSQGIVDAVTTGISKFKGDDANEA